MVLTHSTIEDAWGTADIRRKKKKQEVDPQRDFNGGNRPSNNGNQDGYNGNNGNGRRGGNRNQGYQGDESYEGFQNMQRSPNAGAPTYDAVIADHDYVCNKYGVCGPKLEPFSNSYSSSSGTCGAPIEAPSNYYGGYQDKDQVQIARHRMDDVRGALFAQQDAGSWQKTMTAPVNMDAVDGVYDEELESYIRDKSVGYASEARPVPKQPQQVQQQNQQQRNVNTSSASSSVQQASMQQIQPMPSNVGASISVVSGNTITGAHASAPTASTSATSASTRESSSSNTTASSPWVHVWDMLLFIITGVLFVFIVDQMYRLGIALGVKRSGN